MPVTNQIPFNEYTANGVTTQFAYTFRIITASQMQVYRNGVLVESGYSVAGVNNGSGGTVTFTAAPFPGDVIRLVRFTDTVRDYDYIEAGGLAADTLDDDQDYQTMMIQEAGANALSRNPGTGEWDAEGYRITNVGFPEEYTDAATVLYVDSIVADIVYNGGGVVPLIFEFEGDGVTRTFSVPGITISNAAAYIVTIDGVVQNPGVDYTINVGQQSITFAVAPALGAKIVVRVTAYAQPVTEFTPGAGTIDDVAQFAQTIRPVVIVGELPATGEPGDIVFLTLDGKLYRWDATGSPPGWTAAVASDDIQGQLTSAQIAEVLSTQIVGQLTAAQIEEILASQITGQITSTQIADDAITTPKLAANAVTANELAANSVVAGKILAGTIGVDELAANAVTSDKIAANAITAGKILAGSIGVDELAANSVTATAILAGSVGTDELAANSVVAGKVAAGAISASEISVTELAAISAAMGDLTSGTLTINTTGHIKSGQTAFDTGSGFWLGKDGATTKFSIGNSAGNKLVWDGSTLSITGTVNLTNNIDWSQIDNAPPIPDGSGTNNDLTTGTAFPTGGDDGDLYMRTGSTDPGWYANVGGTWFFQGDVTLTAILNELQVTGGGINLSSGTSAIRSGQTGYNTGSGWWIGRDPTNGARMSMGNGSDAYMRWTGTSLQTSKLVVADAEIYNSPLSPSAARIHTGGGRTAPFVIFDINQGTTDVQLLSFQSPSNGTGHNFKRLAYFNQDALFQVGVVVNGQPGETPEVVSVRLERRVNGGTWELIQVLGTITSNTGTTAPTTGTYVGRYTTPNTWNTLDFRILATGAGLTTVSVFFNNANQSDPLSEDTGGTTTTTPLPPIAWNPPPGAIIP